MTVMSMFLIEHRLYTRGYFRVHREEKLRRCFPSFGLHEQGSIAQALTYAFMYIIYERTHTLMPDCFIKVTFTIMLGY